MKRFQPGSKSESEMTGGYVQILLMTPCYANLSFFTSVLFLGMVSSNRHIMPPHFFQQGLLLNAAGYAGNNCEVLNKSFMQLKAICVSAGLHICSQSCSDPRLDDSQSE